MTGRGQSRASRWWKVHSAELAGLFLNPSQSADGWEREKVFIIVKQADNYPHSWLLTRVRALSRASSPGCEKRDRLTPRAHSLRYTFCRLGEVLTRESSANLGGNTTEIVRNLSHYVMRGRRKLSYVFFKYPRVRSLFPRHPSGGKAPPVIIGCYWRK